MTAEKVEFRIRSASTSDLEEILRHRRGMFRDMAFDAEPALTRAIENSRGFIQRGLKEGWYLGWLAIVQDRCVGGGGLVVTPWTAHPLYPEENRRAYVLNVYTDPEFRGLRIARRIMGAIIQHAKADGFQSLWLHASDAGRHLYDQLGFEPTNEMKLELCRLL